MLVVALAAGLEVITAGLLLAAPDVFARLLFGAELDGAAQALGRLAGISLLALALACWPRRTAAEMSSQPVVALLVFSSGCALFLAYLGVGSTKGVLLWPAAATHGFIAGLLAMRWPGRFRG